MAPASYAAASLAILSLCPDPFSATRAAVQTARVGGCSFARLDPHGVWCDCKRLDSKVLVKEATKVCLKGESYLEVHRDDFRPH